VDGILVCSHRGPYSYRITDGQVSKKPGSGGLVTALASLLRGNSEAVWLACALSDADRVVARDPGAAGESDVRALLLDIPPQTHRRYYDDACNTGLGFLFHGLVDQAHTPTFDARFQRGWQACQDVCRAYAEKLAAQPPDWPVLVEDYHMMLVGDALRQVTGPAGRSGPVCYFHHIAWCGPELFGLLPRQVCRDILTRMLSYDTVGFHARQWADAFLACCDAFLPGAQCGQDGVRWQGREVPVVIAPAAVDVPHLQKILADESAQRWRRKFQRAAGGHRLLVRVDRIDLWKNIIRGFQAFEHMVLAEGVTGVTFLAVLARSRVHLPVYRQYMAACLRTARQVNERLASAGAGARIRVSVAQDHSDHARALAALSLGDATLVNPTSDGLNLVAKESVIATNGTGRMVLSTRAGVHEEIGRWTAGINPFDLLETGSALARALTPGAPWPGPGSEPAQNARALMDTVSSTTPESWLRSRLAPVL
jgi:trehalose 6-phosphate synthase